VIKQGAILGHDQVENANFRKHTLEALEFTAGDQDIMIDPLAETVK